MLFIERHLRSLLACLLSFLTLNELVADREKQMEGAREEFTGKSRRENKEAFVEAEARRADLFWFIELESGNGKKYRSSY